MSNTDVSRRGLLKTSFIGAAAAGAAGFGLTAEAAPARKAAGTYDAVVLGAGPSGLITAITAHDAGAKVVVLEKCDRPDGNAIYALGSVCGWGTRHQKEQVIDESLEVEGKEYYTPTTSPRASTGSKAISASSSARFARCPTRVSDAPAVSWAT